MKKLFVRATLIKVTGWRRDDELVKDHERRGTLDRTRMEREVRERLVDCVDQASAHLPFIYEFTVPADKCGSDSVRDAVVEKFAEEFYKDAYVFPCRGEGEWCVLKECEED